MPIRTRVNCYYSYNLIFYKNKPGTEVECDIISVWCLFVGVTDFNKTILAIYSSDNLPEKSTMTNTSNKTSFTIGITPVNSTNCVTKIYEKKTTHLTYKLKIMASIRHNNKKITMDTVYRKNNTSAIRKRQEQFS